MKNKLGNACKVADGTGAIDVVRITSAALPGVEWDGLVAGSYVLVVGKLVQKGSADAFIKAHKVDAGSLGECAGG